MYIAADVLYVDRRATDAGGAGRQSGAGLKLALGTAQFGLRYGIANTVGQVGQPEIKAILNVATQAGISTLDTAIAYGNSEASLGEVISGASTWQIITKLPPLPEGILDILQWINAQVSGSLERLRVSRLAALLLHRPSDLLGPHGIEYSQALAELKTRGVIEAAGVSVYDPSELDAIWPVYHPDIVQAPVNVLDRRLIKSGWMERLQGNGVRVHARSVFLQGLLLMSPQERPAWFSPWAKLLRQWMDWCKQQDATPLQAALSFVLKQPAVERVVVGVDSVHQLQEIIQASFCDLQTPPSDLFSEDLNLLEPSRWKYV